MSGRLDVSVFENLSDCRRVGSHSLVACVGERTIRITAAEGLSRAEPPRYWAEYEEQTVIETLGVDHLVWVKAVDLPDAVGETIDDCLYAALGWVNGS